MQGYLSKDEQAKIPVYLRVYDISNGKAAMWSQIVLRRKIEGIWHTGIHVFGFEYFYGGGINCMTSSQVESSFDMEIVETRLIGHTIKTRSEFERYFLHLYDKFTPETYDLIKWNCNHFSETCARFLIGKGIPDEILNLPQIVGSTFWGNVALKVFQRVTQGNNPTCFSPDNPSHPRHEFFPDSKEIQSIEVYAECIETRHEIKFSNKVSENVSTHDDENSFPSPLKDRRGSSDSLNTVPNEPQCDSQTPIVSFSPDEIPRELRTNHEKPKPHKFKNPHSNRNPSPKFNENQVSGSQSFSYTPHMQPNNSKLSSNGGHSRAENYNVSLSDSNKHKKVDNADSSDVNARNNPRCPNRTVCNKPNGLPSGNRLDLTRLKEPKDSGCYYGLLLSPRANYSAEVTPRRRKYSFSVGGPSDQTLRRPQQYPATRQRSSSLLRAAPRLSTAENQYVMITPKYWNQNQKMSTNTHVSYASTSGSQTCYIDQGQTINFLSSSKIEYSATDERTDFSQRRAQHQCSAGDLQINSNHVNTPVPPKTIVPKLPHTPRLLNTLQGRSSFVGQIHQPMCIQKNPNHYFDNSKGPDKSRGSTSSLLSSKTYARKASAGPTADLTTIDNAGSIEASTIASTSQSSENSDESTLKAEREAAAKTIKSTVVSHGIDDFLGVPFQMNKLKKQYITCPECGTKSKASDLMCPHCGLDFMLISPLAVTN